MFISRWYLCSAFLCLLSGVLPRGSVALDWPVYPDSTTHELSALYGVFLDGSDPVWMHSGIDIVGPPGTPVYAVDSGWVKTITTKYDHYSYWRVVVGDSAGTGECEAWLYAHIKQSTIPVAAGQRVNAGDYLGDLVDWPYHPGQVEHLHFSRIRYYGDSLQWAIGQDDWVFVANPLDYLTTDNDTAAPAFTDAYADQLLAFCLNETETYFPAGLPLSGDVDIICEASDFHNWFDWNNIPYRLEYAIEGDSMIPWTTAVCFQFELGTYATMHEKSDVVYQDDATCDSRTNFLTGENHFYFNLTNSDGDADVEPTDRLLSWQTANFHNGDYTIFVRAKDKTGNTTVDSMTVTVENSFSLDGSVAFSDGNPDLSGAIVYISPSGESDTTGAAGEFTFSSVGGGTQTVTVSRSNYVTADTALMMNQDRTLQITLDPMPYVCGDADGNETINISDAVFLISYIFAEGPPANPPASADANCDGIVNVTDVVYLITYIFGGGPEPCADCP